jgi:hypothetical protein
MIEKYIHYCANICVALMFTACVVAIAGLLLHLVSLIW